MFPAFVIKALTLAIGFVYPGYQCFKALRRRRPDVRELSFWCRYWVLIACGSFAEYFLDPFCMWLPMYPEAKLALVVFLWHPSTMGADYVYDKFFVPLLTRHEALIDSHLKDVQEQGQAAVVYLWQQGCMHAQVRFMDFLGYLSTLSIEAARQAQQGRNRLSLEPQQVREIRDLDEEGYTMVYREDAEGASSAVIGDTVEGSASNLPGRQGTRGNSHRGADPSHHRQHQQQSHHQSLHNQQQQQQQAPYGEAGLPVSYGSQTNALPPQPQQHKGRHHAAASVAASGAGPVHQESPAVEGEGTHPLTRRRSRRGAAAAVAAR